MTRTQQFRHRLLCSGISVNPAIRLLICLMVLSGCATVAPVIDESLRHNALEGNVRAQYEIGLKYDQAAHSGWGNMLYWDEAEAWFEMAARQGDARAQYRLAAYYFSRRHDYRQSFRLNQLAAQQGLADAQYSLGMHYGQAWGTEQNLILAYKWIALANEGGIIGGSLADTEWLIWKGKMSADQIAEGKRLAAEHTATYGKSQSIASMNQMPNQRMQPDAAKPRR
ncbi:MAG: sel1 repeat family protein [Pseudomonadales bacterium]|nr:sel1 repeat family protein [Pseudomonadales bacterium]